jgi:hypothetical protein
MNRKAILALGVFLITATAHAGDGGIPFSFTAEGGLVPKTPAGGTEGFGNYPLFMNADDWDGPGPAPSSIPNIQSLELEITGLTHTFPQDLDVYLISPFRPSARLLK